METFTNKTLQSHFTKLSYFFCTMVLGKMKMKEKNDLCVLSKHLIAQIEEKLRQWQESIETANQAEINIESSSEFFDQANREALLGLEIEKANRNQKVLSEIRSALKKIKDGTYGICEESGDAIEKNRLLANPLARFSLEAQQEMEAEMKNRRRN